MASEFIFFGFFLVFIIGVLMLDLLVIGRNSHEVSLREATIWSIIWILLALAFALFIRYHGEMVHGIQSFDELKHIVERFAPELKLDPSSYEKSLELFRIHYTINYLTGYLIEKSLSVDNLFVMMAILAAFSVRKSDYKRVIFWGILGAIIMRFIFIFAGAALIYRFEWILYIFGAYLVYVGVKMYIERNKAIRIEPQNQPLIKFLSRRFKVFPRYVKDHFFIRKDGRLYLTPLFLVVVFIEFSDLVFALDSIPAIFAVTRDPFIVFFSNIFAILGLRSLFFLLVKIVEKFYLLKTGVAILLVYVGLKLLMHEWLVPLGFKPVYSLYFILSVIVGSVALSLIFPKKINVPK